MINRLYDALFFRPPTAAPTLPGIGPLTMALHATGDPWISGVILRGEVFDAHILDVMRDLAVPGAAVVDVGANIGWFTVIASRLVGASGHVFAVEPEPKNLRLLRRNVARNRCANVTVLPHAAGVERRAVLFRSPDNQGDHRLEIASERPDGVAVTVRPLDALLARNKRPIGVVKMDTQGSESEVLRGMPATLAAHPRVRVILEFWPFGLLRCGSSVAELAALLDGRPHSLWLLMPDGTTEETTAKSLPALATARFDPDSGNHADLVWLAADDATAIEAMRRRAAPA